MIIRGKGFCKVPRVRIGNHNCEVVSHTCNEIEVVTPPIEEVPVSIGDFLPDYVSKDCVVEGSDLTTGNNLVTPSGDNTVV